MSTSFTGRRLDDTKNGDFPVPYDDLQPGDIWKVLDHGTGKPRVVQNDSNLTGFVWLCVAPGPDGLKLLATLELHTVREHDDGTVSVRSGDGSSNSILVTRRPNESWHGYIEHNVWTAC